MLDLAIYNVIVELFNGSLKYRELKIIIDGFLVCYKDKNF